MSTSQSDESSVTEAVVGVASSVAAAFAFLSIIELLAYGWEEVATSLLIIWSIFGCTLLALYFTFFREKPASRGELRARPEPTFANQLQAFFNDLPGAPGGKKVDLTGLSVELIDPIRELLRPGKRYISLDELCALYAKATELMAERAKHARQHRQALELEMEYELLRSRASYLASLTEEQRGIVALHLQAKAEAELRARVAPAAFPTLISSSSIVQRCTTTWRKD